MVSHGSLWLAAVGLFKYDYLQHQLLAGQWQGRPILHAHLCMIIWLVISATSSSTVWPEPAACRTVPSVKMGPGHTVFTLQRMIVLSATGAKCLVIGVRFLKAAKGEQALQSTNTQHCNTTRIA